MKKVINRGKRSKRLNEVKQFKNSFLEIRHSTNSNCNIMHMGNRILLN